MKTIIFFTLVSILTSCSYSGMDDDYGYIQPELQQYVDEYLREAKKRNIDIDISILKANIYDINVFGRANSTLKEILIDDKFFYTYSSIDKYSIEVEVIVFHELSHVLLYQGHRDNKPSIMNTTPNITSYKDKLKLREEYLNELFGFKN